MESQPLRMTALFAKQMEPIRVWESCSRLSAILEGKPLGLRSRLESDEVRKDSVSSTVPSSILDNAAQGEQTASKTVGVSAMTQGFDCSVIRQVRRVPQTALRTALNTVGS